MEESILVVPRRVLFGENNERYFNGFMPAVNSDLLGTIKAGCEFRPRGRMEEDESYQQIIPYILFRHGKRLFVYKRLKAGGEKRLHNLYSIGIGGHINDGDKDGDIISTALKREFEEEVYYPHAYEVKLVGFLNDDSNPVGRVHFGLVFLAEGKEAGIKVRESESLEGRLMGRDEIEKLASSFESWSKLVWEWAKKML